MVLISAGELRSDKPLLINRLFAEGPKLDELVDCPGLTTATGLLAHGVEDRAADAEARH